jgi:Na+-driven multidrug efflux pump
MVMQITGAVVNIILDPMLIFGYLGFPAMGAKGAAIATVFAQIVSMVLGVAFNLLKNKEIELSPRKFHFDFKYIKTICAVGIPTMIMQSMSSVMCFGINKLLLAYSTTATAVFGAFSPSEEMYSLGVTALRILGLTFTFGSVTVVISYALQGFSRGVSSLIVSAGRQVILLLPLAVLLGTLMGINGIWWSFLVAEVIDMVLSLIFLGAIEKKELATLS